MMKQINAKEPTWLKIPIGREADQFIYKHDRGVERESSWKRLQLNGQNTT